NPRILQNCTRDGDSLPLPAAQLRPALSDHGVVLPWERYNEFMCVSGFSSGDHFFLSRIQPAIEDVVANRAAEQNGLLWHYGHLRTQALLRHRAQVMAVDPHAAAGRIVEPRNQVE